MHMDLTGKFSSHTREELAQMPAREVRELVASRQITREQQLQAYFGGHNSMGAPKLVQAESKRNREEKRARAAAETSARTFSWQLNW